MIVEDDYLIAELLMEILEAAGWQAVGPVGHLADALDTAASEELDAAVLDVNLGGQPVYPVAEALDRRRVPFAFLTGYEIGALPHPYCQRPCLGKPVRVRELIDMVARLIPPAAEVS